MPSHIRTSRNRASVGAAATTFACAAAGGNGSLGLRARRTGGAASAPAERAVGLGGEKEVALGEAVDLVRPDFHGAAAPAHVQIRVMALLFRDVAHVVGELHRRRKVPELVVTQ